MQYVLKLTTLGVKHHVFRVVSVDGMADVEHVLNLCDLSFDYAGYNSKELYFARTESAYKALAVDCPDEDDDHYGPTGKEFAPFWQESLNLAALELKSFKLLEHKSDFLGRFDDLIESQRQALALNASCDLHPGEQEGVRFKFIYVLNGVEHLVEVMTSAQKLKCFLPATLMGEGLIVDNDDNKPLSLDMINQCLQEHEQDEELCEGLNLKDCTARMRALGALRNGDNINNALVKAGAAPLNFVVNQLYNYQISCLCN